MDLNRRQALGVIGTFLTAPSLLVTPKKKIVRLDEHLIPTGFPALDMAMGGGLRRGTINTIIGHQGSGKTAFMRSMALKAAEKSSVGVIPERGKAHLLVHRGVDVSPFEGHLWYYPHNFLDDYKEGDLWEFMMERHDIIFDESFYHVLGHMAYVAWTSPFKDEAFDLMEYRTNKVRTVAAMAHEYDCAVVLTIPTKPSLPLANAPAGLRIAHAPAYMSSVIFSMSPSKESMHANYGPFFECELVKNRWKPIHEEKAGVCLHAGTLTQHMRLNQAVFRMEPMCYSQGNHYDPPWNQEHCSGACKRCS